MDEEFTKEELAIMLKAVGRELAFINSLWFFHDMPEEDWKRNHAIWTNVQSKIQKIIDYRKFS